MREIRGRLQERPLAFGSCSEVDLLNVPDGPAPRDGRMHTSIKSFAPVIVSLVAGDGHAVRRYNLSRLRVAAGRWLQL